MSTSEGSMPARYQINIESMCASRKTIELTRCSASVNTLSREANNNLIPSATLSFSKSRSRSFSRFSNVTDLISVSPSFAFKDEDTEVNTGENCGGRCLDGSDAGVGGEESPNLSIKDIVGNDGKERGGETHGSNLTRESSSSKVRYSGLNFGGTGDRAKLLGVKGPIYTKPPQSATPFPKA